MGLLKSPEPPLEKGAEEDAFADCCGFRAGSIFNLKRNI